MKVRIIKTIIGWFWVRYPYLMMDVVIPERHHIHKNPPLTGKGSRRRPAETLPAQNYPVAGE